MRHRSSVGIVNNLLKLLSERSVLLVIVLTGLVLSYGGIGVFFIAFDVCPIAVTLYQRADILKKFIVASIMVVPARIYMAMLPGLPLTQNLSPTRFFNTNAYAGATQGIIISIIMFVSSYTYLPWQIRLAKKNGEHCVPAPGKIIMDLSSIESGASPELWRCYAPIVILLAAMFGLQWFTSMPANFAGACVMTLAVLVDCVLLHGALEWKKDINEELGTPWGVCVNATNAPVPAGELAKALRKGDIFCRYFQGMKHNIISAGGSIDADVLEGHCRWVIFDAANGKANFGLRTAKVALKARFLLDIISSDVTVDKFNMPHTTRICRQYFRSTLRWGWT